jgi:hypothetical protein
MLFDTKYRCFYPPAIRRVMNQGAILIYKYSKCLFNCIYDTSFFSLEEIAKFKAKLQKFADEFKVKVEVDVID